MAIIVIETPCAMICYGLPGIETFDICVSALYNVMKFFLAVFNDH